MEPRWLVRGALGAVTVIAALAAVVVSGAPMEGETIRSVIERVVLVRSVSEPRWVRCLARVDQALAEGNVGRAIYEWREAYGAAVASRLWEALLAVGDAALRLEAHATAPGAFRRHAERAYLEALFEARAHGAVDGMHRVAEAFDRLGATDKAAIARRMAD